MHITDNSKPRGQRVTELRQGTVVRHMLQVGGHDYLMRTHACWDVLGATTFLRLHDGEIIRVPNTTTVEPVTATLTIEP